MCIGRYITNEVNYKIVKGGQKLNIYYKERVLGLIVLRTKAVGAVWVNWSDIFPFLWLLCLPASTLIRAGGVECKPHSIE